MQQLSSCFSYSLFIYFSILYQGLVTPFIASLALGSIGDYLVLTMIGMALMSTGSGEVMAISSILVYDVYQTHITPFRLAFIVYLDIQP